MAAVVVGAAFVGSLAAAFVVQKQALTTLEHLAEVRNLRMAHCHRTRIPIAA